MHVAGADRADEFLPAAFAQGENQKDMAPRLGPSDCPQSFLGGCVGRVGQDHDGPRKQPLDLVNGNAVLLAFGPVPGIPIKT